MSDLRAECEQAVIATMPHGNLHIAAIKLSASEVLDAVLDVLTERADEWHKLIGKWQMPTEYELIQAAAVLRKPGSSE